MWGQTAFKGFLRDCSAFVRTLSVFHVFGQYGCYLSTVSGPSMFPTFSGQNEFVVVQAVSPLLGPITRGDVVICIRPVDPSEHIVKRVSAVAGEEVLIFPTKDNPDLQKVKVPKGHVWLQGDNLLHSRDSREYGPIPLALVKGRVLYQVWPAWKKISHEELGG
mmetsp:Transcript_23493/g.64778  ORF Transcript_23493/g.64778 Transcript_23493/m.64778 type:complete len:163 (+) Transcript_23493:133-621(+)